MSRKTMISTALGAAILMLAIPGIATGHHEPGHDEPVPKHVIVANDASQAIPTEVEGSVEVLQTGPWTVELDEDWNSAGDPVHVYEQPHEPFQYTFTHTTQGDPQASIPGCARVPIPPGRTLEVQSVFVDIPFVHHETRPDAQVVLEHESGGITQVGGFDFLDTGPESDFPRGWWGNLTPVTLFAGEVGSETIGLMVCQDHGAFENQADSIFTGVVSGRLE